MRDYYEILGVSKDASQQEIKKKYRELALKMHPDRLVGKSDSEKKEIEKKLQEITNAYEVLSNEESRKRYDLERSGGFGASSFGGFGESSIFEEIFDNLFWGNDANRSSRSRGGSDRTRKGEDILLSISLSFKEFVLGCEKNFRVEILKSCRKCSQTGAYSNDHIKTCANCSGKGFVDVVQRSIFGSIRTQVACNACGGEGKIITKKCDICYGNKFVKEPKDIKLRIPRGIQPGQRMTMKGAGNDGLRSSQSGDIFIEIKLKENKYFQRKGNDIHVNLPVSFIDCMLGESVGVFTVEGLEQVNVPKGTQVGDYIVLKNRGFYKEVNKELRGDFYIWFQVRLPKKIGQETEKIFRNIRDNAKWNPNREFIDKNRNELE